MVALLAREGSTVTLAALSPLGQRLMKLTWDRQGVQCQVDPSVGAGFDAQQALRDLVFASWPPEALRAALVGGPWSAAFDPDGRRTLSCGGRIRLSVSGRTDSPQGQVLRHLPEGYSITVKELNDHDE